MSPKVTDTASGGVPNDGQRAHRRGGAEGRGGPPPGRDRGPGVADRAGTGRAAPPGPDPVPGRLVLHDERARRPLAVPGVGPPGWGGPFSGR